MRIEKNIADELAARVLRATVILRDEPLAKHTTMRIGGPADVYVEPASEADLANVLKFCGDRDVPFFILGRGSNLLVRDGGVRGVVICLAHPHFSKIEIVGERLHCGAGAKLKNVSVEAKRNNLSGVEFLEGIPGSVGGALRMNAGAMGAATFGAVESFRFMDYDGEIHERVAGEVPVEYRACPLLKTHVALGAVFKCTPLPRAEIERRMMAYSEKRWESQPAAPSAGCIFKNTAAVPAGKLIDEIGLKGAHVGGAMVSLEHGNFVVNGGTATARDVLELIALLQARAKEARGIELHTEVEIIGED
ncbi:MAG: UDP-N-acetylmuramate dehydrogenase [Verrucomicrobiales bacterium]|nr:UDP-N-acetylmuramate dehydrogenase [Verrucomicrobiales bacterium]